VDRRKINRGRQWFAIARTFTKDRFQVALNKYYYIPPIIVGVLLFAIGGFPMVLWGVFLKTVIGWHFTWLVNSATHLWGTRRFETRDDSRNNALIAAVTFGEGWHNNHHAHPRSARHGLSWYEIDINWIQIWLLEKFGLAENVLLLQRPDR
jgi:stearoyl-CoA desaturase (delta-9 desaturase)